MASFPYRPYGPERCALSVAEWPAADRALWQAAQRSGGFLEEAGRAARWAAESRYRVERGYGRYLTWLACTQQLDPEASVASRLTRPIVAAFVEHLLALNTAQTVISRLNTLHLFARATVPNRDWSFLGQLQQQLRSKVRDSRQKALRLRHTIELLELGKALIGRLSCDEGAGVPRRQAIACRDGLMIALLALRPLRLKNFAALTIGRHLVQQAGTWQIRFGAEETKNKRPIEISFPGQLVPFLDLYLERVRPALLQRDWPLRADDGRLWLGQGGRPLSDRRICHCIQHRTEQAFGRSVYPHLFRDAAATTMALEDPEHVRVAAQILGHGSFRTTERFYRMSRSAEAVRAYSDLLDQLRSTNMER
jgi:integrase/recombinase XerD